MRQRRWLELIKDYDLQILYHPGKANTVADALSRKSIGNLACLLTGQKELLCDLEKSEIEIVLREQGGTLAAISARPALIEEIKEKQQLDDFLKKIIEERDSKPKPGFKFENNVLKFQERLCVPNDTELKRRVLQDGQNSKLSIHPGNTKMYQDLKQNFWWPGMKKEIADFVSKCLHSQQVKAEHLRPAGLLQPQPIPEWKWEHITMDFIVGLPRSRKRYGFNLGYC